MQIPHQQVGSRSSVALPKGKGKGKLDDPGTTSQPGARGRWLDGPQTHVGCWKRGGVGGVPAESQSSVEVRSLEAALGPEEPRLLSSRESGQVRVGHCRHGRPQGCRDGSVGFCFETAQKDGQELPTDAQIRAREAVTERDEECAAKVLRLE